LTKHGRSGHATRSPRFRFLLKLEAQKNDRKDCSRIKDPKQSVEELFHPRWAMLMAGNYRCIAEDGMRTAREAIHSDLEASRSIYDFVLDVCVKIGASRDELVPFEKYAAAAESLSRPASAARALNNGAPNIERADKLVQLAAKQKGMRHPALDAIVALVDRRLEANRKMKPAAA
jgi:hypothetical protein